MSFLQFPEENYIIALDNNTTEKMGSFQLEESALLNCIRALIHINGTLSGNEEARINICTDARCQRVLHRSDWTKLNVLGDTNIFGWLKFPFHSENINENYTYHLQFEIKNYTRNGNSFYIALCRDMIRQVYSDADLFQDAPYAFEVYTWK